jgi:hypothetical protein
VRTEYVAGIPILDSQGERSLSDKKKKKKKNFLFLIEEDFSGNLNNSAYRSRLLVK